MSKKTPPMGPVAGAVFMRMKRPRAGCADTDDAPPVLRVRMDAATSLRAVLPATAAAQETLCFRLVTPLPQAQTQAQAQVQAQPPPSVAPSPGSLLLVERIWDLRHCLLVDCANVGEREETSLYVLVSAAETDPLPEPCSATMDDDEEEEAEDEFGFDSLCITPPRSRMRKRERERPGAAPEFVLSDAPDVVRDASGAEAEWLCDVLRGYGHDALVLESTEPNGCEPELYLYPDHRRDDEYDSNAADFSGNEYPEEPSDSDAFGTEDAASSERLWRRGGTRRQVPLTMWCEDEYEEAPLEGGWGSEDEDYDYDDI